MSSTCFFHQGWRFCLSGIFPMADALSACRDAQGRDVYDPAYSDEGWQEVTVPGLRPFMMPEEWRLTWVADEPEGQRLQLTLTDMSGAEIARGYAFPIGLTAACFTDIASEFAGAPLSEYRLWDQITVGLGSKAAAFRQAIFFSSDKKLLDTYVLELYHAPAEMHLWFPYCEGAEAEALAAQMKGLISSYLD